MVLPERPGMLSDAIALRGESIRAAREARGWSQAKLADAVGTTQQTIDRIEKGQTDYSRYLDRIFDALEIVRPASAEEIAQAVARSENEAARNRDAKTLLDPGQSKPSLSYEQIREVFLDTLLPVRQIYGDNTTRYDATIYIRRPPILAGKTSAYGVFTYSGDMEPVFRGTDIALIDPTAPIAPNSEVLLLGLDVDRADSSDQVPAFLCTLLDRDKEHLRVRTWSPLRDSTLSAGSWPIIHPVVGKQQRGF